jgi:hypothetical protein
MCGSDLTVGASAAAGESRDSTIESGSATWLLGGLLNRESWPRSADSCKRLLGLCVCEPEPSVDPQGGHPACPGEKRPTATYVLPARKGPAPRGHQGPKMHGAFATGGANGELTTSRSPTKATKDRASRTRTAET